MPDLFHLRAVDEVDVERALGLLGAAPAERGVGSARAGRTRRSRPCRHSVSFGASLRGMFERGIGVWLGWLAVPLLACGGTDGDSDTNAATDGADASSSSTTTATDPTTTTTDPTTDPSSTSTTDVDPSTSSSGDAPTSDESTGGSESTGSEVVPEGCFDYPSFVPTDVSLRNDVMPIFVESCWMCHQTPGNGLFLGYGGNTDAEATAVRDNLLTVTPNQAPNETFVIPGDPLNSWMMAKVEYDNPGGDCPLIDCTNPGCDWFAPPSEILPTAQLDVLRSWIANGALDN